MDLIVTKTLCTGDMLCTGDRHLYVVKGVLTELAREWVVQQYVREAAARGTVGQIT